MIQDEVEADMFAQSSNWLEIAQSCKRDVGGPDATCEPFWARALLESGRVGSTLPVTPDPAAGAMRWIFPGVLVPSQDSILRERVLKAIGEAYSGRGGLLVRNDDPDAARDLLNHLARGRDQWDVVVFAVVAGSASHRAVYDAAAAPGIRVRCIGTSDSPYFEIGGSVDALIARLPKKVRWTIRKGEKDLAGLGMLRYQEYTRPEQTAELSGAIAAVERSSWKREAGTSIASDPAQQRFYDAMTPRAAEAGRLSGHVLWLNDAPIAFILGLLDEQGVFLDLKESFSADFANFSPGHVLKRHALAQLIERGARIYDFMGACEPYKMRWTSTTYRQFSLALYLDTVRGLACYLRSRVGSRSTPIPSP